MLSRRAFPIALAGLACLPARAAPSLWVSAAVPPFLSQGAAGPQGYAFALFEKVVQQAGLAAQLRLYPWARAQRMLAAGEAHAALVMARTPDREAAYRWLFPVASFRFVVVTRAGDPPASGDIAALRDRRVGSLRASASRGMLEAAGATRVVEGHDYADLMALLRRGVVDAVIAPDAVMYSLAAEPAASAPRFARLEQGRELYAAAGPAMPDDMVERVRAAYQRLAASGAVARLKKRHPEAASDGG